MLRESDDMVESCFHQQKKRKTTIVQSVLQGVMKYVDSPNESFKITPAGGTVVPSSLYYEDVGNDAKGK